MLDSLNGKTVLITGASRGQGAEEAALFARLGCVVYLADVDAAGEDTASTIRAAGGDATFLQLDVTDEAGWNRCVEQIDGRSGTLHALINNAGIAARRARVMEMEVADWDRILAVNLTGPMLGIRATAALIRDSGGGAIVNIGSAAAVTGHFSTSYSSAKWGLRGLTKSAAMELAPWNIRVVAVHPGIVQTPIIEGSDDFVAAMVDATPARRIGQPEDVAHVVAFLASDLASFVTGIDVPVDGGFTEVGLYNRIAQDVQRRDSKW